MTNEQIQQNSINFGPKCSPEIENVPQTAFVVFAAFRDSVLAPGPAGVVEGPGRMSGVASLPPCITSHNLGLTDISDSGIVVRWLDLHCFVSMLCVWIVWWFS